MISLSSEDSTRILIIGFFLGCAFSGGAIDSLKSLVNCLLVPLYTIASSAFLLNLFYQKCGNGSDDDYRLSRLRRCISGRDFDSRLTNRSDIIKQSHEDTSTETATGEPVGVGVGQSTSVESLQQVNLTGSYKLVKNEGFDKFLGAQGVPWALRRAVDKAQPIHHITHTGNEIRIKITGIITSESTFQIGGPPVETQIRGRVFLDTVSYLDSCDGIQVHKVNRRERYKIIVTRQLNADRGRM
eukprot:CAMPEP_0113585382 /NCGR_PEP_ID=MMETSP0015_2-20120614/33667_1 /TAXON_ID=2838 /ORGANISM="Odontella" /LENGTH=241 /DNA_ID=CAMNT_0000490615 /DNA_START=72 /DNA_END=794 /DNA_ORIENTATION=- /assembly_acc=CAM_ASM_000160